MEDSNGSVDTPPPTLLQRITTPAEIAHASTQTEDMEDTDHPGGQWMHFDPSNTSHYVTVRSLCLSVVQVLEFLDRGISQIGSRPNVSIRKSS